MKAGPGIRSSFAAGVFALAIGWAGLAALPAAAPAVAASLGAAVAGAPSEEIPVDVELVLAVDVSMSMMIQELRIQRDGYVAAFSDSQVLEAMFSGPRRQIAIAYVEWSGVDEQHVVVPWTVLYGPADAKRFAEALENAPTRRYFRTSVSGALEFAAAIFEGNGIRGDVRVIDISGDGANNEGLPVAEVRDRLVGAGIIINGLPLMTNLGLISNYDVGDLDTYYAECVIGGSGAFSLPVRSWEEFATAVRRKLIREVSRFMPQPPDAQMLHARLQDAVYDCLVGEKLWNRQQGK